MGIRPFRGHRVGHYQIEEPPGALRTQADSTSALGEQLKPSCSVA